MWEGDRVREGRERERVDELKTIKVCIREKGVCKVWIFLCDVNFEMSFSFLSVPSFLSFIFHFLLFLLASLHSLTFLSLFPPPSHSWRTGMEWQDSWVSLEKPILMASDETSEGSNIVRNFLKEKYFSRGRKERTFFPFLVFSSRLPNSLSLLSHIIFLSLSLSIPSLSLSIFFSVET